MVSVNGLVPVRHLTKTFASGKTEKMVYQVVILDDNVGLLGVDGNDSLPGSVSWWQWWSNNSGNVYYRCDVWKCCNHLWPGPCRRWFAQWEDGSGGARPVHLRQVLQDLSDDLSKVGHSSLTSSSWSSMMGKSVQERHWRTISFNHRGPEGHDWLRKVRNFTYFSKLPFTSVL